MDGYQEMYPDLYSKYGDVLSVMEVADYLDISSNTAYTLLKKRRIRGRRVGGKWRITRKNLIDFLEK